VEKDNVPEMPGGTSFIKQGMMLRMFAVPAQEQP
jgi:hypothetical protein